MPHNKKHRRGLLPDDFVPSFGPGRFDRDPVTGLVNYPPDTGLKWSTYFANMIQLAMMVLSRGLYTPKISRQGDRYWMPGGAGYERVQDAAAQAFERRTSTTTVEEANETAIKILTKEIEDGSLLGLPINSNKKDEALDVLGTLPANVDAQRNALYRTPVTATKLAPPPPLPPELRQRTDRILSALRFAGAPGRYPANVQAPTKSEIARAKERAASDSAYAETLSSRLARATSRQPPVAQVPVGRSALGPPWQAAAQPAGAPATAVVQPVQAGAAIKPDPAGRAIKPTIPVRFLPDSVIKPVQAGAAIKPDPALTFNTMAEAEEYVGRGRGLVPRSDEVPPRRTSTQPITGVDSPAKARVDQARAERAAEARRSAIPSAERVADVQRFSIPSQPGLSTDQLAVIGRL